MLHRFIACITFSIVLAAFRGAFALSLPNVTASGYVTISKELGSRLFYAFYEAQQPVKLLSNVPVILWLQGGPGCASMFGNLYELGPQLVTPQMALEDNPGAWNRRYGLLFIDQPIGTGFSVKGEEPIPTDEMKLAMDLYTGLQGVFTEQQVLRGRPLIITGESYAGKYVPSIGHFILQVQEALGLSDEQLRVRRDLPSQALSLGAPAFKLLGLAIGNGLTDPIVQVSTCADTAYFMGIINAAERENASEMQRAVIRSIASEQWPQAHSQREELLSFIKDASGTDTLLDIRRQRPYDADETVAQFLNQDQVKEHLGADRDVVFESCSAEVDEALGPDVMQSVKHLIPDILRVMPLLLYQGQFDVQDGVASNEEWVNLLQWWGDEGFRTAERRVWRGNPGVDQGQGAEDDEAVLGYWKQYGTLSLVVVRNAGHLVPTDQPVVTQNMLETWVETSE